MAAVAAQLEILGLRTVTIADIAATLDAPAGSVRVREAVRSLRAHGWLAPLPVRGAYEYLPAASGSDRSGDPLIEARAARQRWPALRLQLVLGGAAYLQGYADRPPSEYVLAIEAGSTAYKGLNASYRIHRVLSARLFGAQELRGVPVSGPSRLLFDVALWPAEAGDLRDADHWLARALRDAHADDAVDFALRIGKDRVTARAGYLADVFKAHEIADALATLHPTVRVAFGHPDAPVARRDSRFRVTDRLGVAGE